MPRIAVNTRSLTAPFTGVQRFTSEVLKRSNGDIEEVDPERPLHGILGHTWEQFALPLRIKGKLLFSPSNTGPLQITKQIVVIHDAAIFDVPETFSPLFVAWYRFLLPKLAQRVRRIITVSEFTKERLLFHTNVDDNKIDVVPGGVGPQFCPEAISGIETVIERLKFPSRNYVLALGSLEPRKNVARLLRAWERIQSRISDCIWLVIVGGTSAVFRAANIDRLPNRVFLAGHTDDRWLPAIVAGAIAVAYPSLYEGFGLPALEAMASGTPILTSDRASLPALVGDAGLLIDPTDVDSIADGLYRLIQTPELRDDLRAKGLTRAPMFSWDETARHVWKIVRRESEEG